MKFHPDKASPLLDNGKPCPDTVFVFFCNEIGETSGTTVKIASVFGRNKWTIKGPSGSSYALATKEADGIKPKLENDIYAQVQELQSFALANPHLTFFVQKPGKNEVPNEIIAPMFCNMPNNVLASQCWSGWTSALLDGHLLEKRYCKTCKFKQLRSKPIPASLHPIYQCAKMHDGIWLGENYVCDQYEQRL